MKTTVQTVCSAIAVVVLATIMGIVTFASSGTASADSDVSAKIEKIYTEDYQEQAQSTLDTKKARGGWTVDNMLVEENPYGTNTTSLYVYFTTDDVTQVSYTVSTPSTDYPDFSATPAGGDDYSTTHEFQVIGLIPGKDNDITITLTSQNGGTVTRTIHKKAAATIGDEQVQLERSVTQTGSKTEYAGTVGNGLYAVLGNDSNEQDLIYLYDDYGVLRGEIPILYYRAQRLVFNDGLMYFSASTHDIVAMNNLGRIEKFYNLGDQYILHHDYVFDDSGDLLVLATDMKSNTVQDRIVRVNLATGKTTLLVDMGDLLGDYKSTTKHDANSKATSTDSGSDSWDWIHLNTIQYVGDDSIIVSSRETSSIIKIDNVSTSPTLKYIIGEKTFWDETDYANYNLTKIGDFPSSGGQHTVTYVKDDSLPDGQYYIYMFNNNGGVSATNDYDWSQIPGMVTKLNSTATDVHSYFQKYLVDENAGTYSLVSRFEVPFSGYISSAEEYEDGTIVTESGIKGTWCVYTADGTLLRDYTMKINTAFIYRVFKYDFKGFWFA
ncbi:aryl-sulfate sulfotransferase [Bifidobacterium callimiconis]|uniref:Arylsulfotransferase n=1 Tax=Bifidobacterium callimiconis TaxID=2306973 RepID=A0A430FH72_9BIFI|nr:aryl-sulfate sulfotransferase [Bifidobacterium callimiconis]RSX52058.1 Arylsulfotransferase [Bifidobacterium callimiconis]